MALPPVVFIPGFPASALIDRTTGEVLFPPPWWQTLPLLPYKKKLIARLATDRDGIVAGDPILKVTGLAKQAASLYDNLARLGYDTSSSATANFRAVGWDWRKGIDDVATQTSIAAAIDSFAEKVVVVMHSTGGLALRAFLEANPRYAEKIARIVAFAVPWAGTLDAFRALSKGSSERFLFLIGFSAREVRQVASRCQAAYDLCPPDPTETDMTSVSGDPIRMFLRNDVPAGPLVSPSEWTSDPAMQRLAANAHARFGTRSKNIVLDGYATPPIVNICGWGGLTLDSCTLADGQLRFRESSEKTGDSTVPFVSSSWLRDDGDRVKAFYVPVGAYEHNAIPEPHPRIWDAPPVISLLSSLFGFAQAKPFLAAAVDPDDNFPSRDPVRIRVSAADANGRALPSARIILRLPPANPTFALPPGRRRLDIDLARAGLPNNANGFARIEVEATWSGGSARTAIAIRVA